MEICQNGNVEQRSAEKVISNEEYALLRTGSEVTATNKDLERKGSRIEEDDGIGHDHGIGPDHSTK